MFPHPRFQLIFNKFIGILFSMKLVADILINQFLRTYLHEFSLAEFEMLLTCAGVKCSSEEFELFLECCQNVFTLADGRYITRAAVFTGKTFSFKPLPKEIKKGVFVVGCRCMPFVDPERLPHELKFHLNGKQIKTQAVEFDADSALDFYALYGEEFAVQYLASDPANSDIDLAASDFMLPPRVKLTAVPLEPLIKTCGFKAGDRILCSVSDWDHSVIDITVLPRSSASLKIEARDILREDWYRALERYLLDNFEAAGPCSSIEEQLALVFADFHEELCTENCGSVEEFFKKTNKIGFEEFGVETRLWRRGELPPAVGCWNSDEHSPNHADAERSALDAILFFEELEDTTVDSFIKDQMYRNLNDPEEIAKRLYPYSSILPQEQRKEMLLRLKNRRVILERDYNRFADFELGALRHTALTLYTDVNRIICEIDRSNGSLSDFPQQPLVILSQLYGHIKRIVEYIETEPDVALKEKNEIKLSLEGMEFNFDEVQGQILTALEKKNRNCFIVVK